MIQKKKKSRIESKSTKRDRRESERFGLGKKRSVVEGEED